MTKIDLNVWELNRYLSAYKSSYYGHNGKFKVDLLLNIKKVSFSFGLAKKEEWIVRYLSNPSQSLSQVLYLPARYH